MRGDVRGCRASRIAGGCRDWDLGPRTGLRGSRVLGIKARV